MTTEHIGKLISQATDKLITELEAGKSEQLRAYLAAIGRFYRYSLGNVLLIWSQCPTATHVAGFCTWRQLGRQVRRGEHGIRILAPVLRRLPAENREADEDKVVAFRPAYIFDVMQTSSIDGHDRTFPEFATVKGEPRVYRDRLHGFLRARGITLVFSRLPGMVQGMSVGGKIVVRDDLTPAEQFSTTVHEAAHELLHHGEEANGVAKATREVEAESISFVVSQVIGLDCNTAAADYIKLYDGKKETLLASLERIRSVAGEIIEAILDDADADEGSRQFTPEGSLAAATA